MSRNTRLAGGRKHSGKLAGAARAGGVRTKRPLLIEGLEDWVRPSGPPALPAPAAQSRVVGGHGTVEGGAARVGFTHASDHLGQGVTYSYDFDARGTFEVTGSAAATAAVPSALTADGPKTVDVRGRL